MIINVAPQASIATTPSPSSPEEGTTQGAAGKEKFSNSQILDKKKTCD